MEQRLLVLDDTGLIVLEYLQQRPFGGFPREAGDQFFIWANDNQANPDHVLSVHITPNEERGFAEFPEDVDLSTFDPSDRKFVAVAVASEVAPPIQVAGDRGWRNHNEALARNGITVQFVCP